MSRIAEAPVTTARSKKRRWKLWLVLLFLVLPVLIFASYTWVTLHYAYSSGERIGYLQKISQKGWLCKTWEGEMAMVTMPGTVAEKFQFTVPDDAVAAKLTGDIGRRVSISYKQHKWIPSSCFGDTPYFVYDVRVAEPPPGVQ